MSRADLEGLTSEKHPAEDAGEQIETNRELTDDELEQAAGGDDGWGGGTEPAPGGGG